MRSINLTTSSLSSNSPLWIWLQMYNLNYLNVLPIIWLLLCKPVRTCPQTCDQCKTCSSFCLLIAIVVIGTQSAGTWPAPQKTGVFGSGTRFWVAVIKSSRVIPSPWPVWNGVEMGCCIPRHRTGPSRSGDPKMYVYLWGHFLHITR